MRSMSYVLTGRPRNRPDCIDYAQAHKPRSIRIELMTNENVADEFVARNLFATYIWTFEDRVVTYEEAYGRCFQHEPYERQCVSIDNANRRLARALENLSERAGIPIEGAGARFSYDLAYGKP
jgi:hypothetical protein